MKESLHPEPKKVSFTDQQILDGLKDNDERQQRFFQDLFYLRYVNYLYKVGMQKCRNFADSEELAKDVVQETFIKAFKAINRFTLSPLVPVADHPYLIKAWLGKIASNCFRKIYASRVNKNLADDDYRIYEEVICPMCGDFLKEDRKTYFCEKNHFKISKQTHTQSHSIIEEGKSVDLLQSLFGKSEVEVPNEFRVILQQAMNQLKDAHKHILLTYASEGCINSTSHLGDSTMKYLCKTYDTSPENIRQIKRRALDKVRQFCFATINTKTLTQ